MKLPRLDMLLIVTGAGPEAETAHRPAAYTLRSRLCDHLSLERVAVCCDLWYLNQPYLSAAPVVSIGGPEVNALTAYLADKLPSVLLVEDRLTVQMDTDDDPVRACCWGVDAQTTARATELFAQRYLAEFLAAA